MREAIRHVVLPMVVGLPMLCCVPALGGDKVEPGSVTGTVARAEKDLGSKAMFQVVSLTDFAKKTTVKVVSQEEYVALQDEVRTKNSLLPKAIQLAKKEWESDEANKHKIFLTGSVAVEKLTSLGTFKTKPEADAAVGRYQKPPSDKTEKSAYLNEKLKTLRNSLQHPPNYTDVTAMTDWYARVNKEIKATEDSIAERKAKHDERAELEESMRNIILAKLDELLPPPAAADKK
jgi:hypothetical protein